MENAKKTYIIAWVENEDNIFTLATLIEIVAKRIAQLEKIDEEKGDDNYR